MSKCKDATNWELPENKKQMSDFVLDNLGWVDDFRAAPGECGLPLTRKIYILTLLQKGHSIRTLREMKFPRVYVEEVLAMMQEMERKRRQAEILKEYSNE